MKTLAATALYALAGASTALAAVSSLKTITKTPSTLSNTNRYIVEFEQGLKRREPGSLHRRLYQSLEERAVPFSVDHEFDHEGLFSGVAVTLTVRPSRAFGLTYRALTQSPTQSARHMEELARIPGVARIHPNRKVPRPQ